MVLWSMVNVLKKIFDKNIYIASNLQLAINLFLEENEKNHFCIN